MVQSDNGASGRNRPIIDEEPISQGIEDETEEVLSGINNGKLG